MVMLDQTPKCSSLNPKNNRKVKKKKGRRIGSTKRKILKRLTEESLSQEDLSKRLKRSISTINEHIHDLLQQGLIEKQNLGKVSVYHVRSEFRKILKGADADPAVGPFHVHRITLEFEIIRDVKKTPTGWNLGKTQDKWNWESHTNYLQTKLGTVFIEKFPHRFKVFLPQLIHDNPDIIARTRNALGWAVYGWLGEQFPGIRLRAVDENGQFRQAHKTTTMHYGLPNDPLARLCYKKGLSLKSKVFEVDNSPKKIADLRKIFPNCQGEIEGVRGAISEEDILKIFDEYHHIADGSFSRARMDDHEGRLDKLLKVGEQQAAHADKLDNAMEKITQQLSVLIQASTVTQQMINTFVQGIAADRGVQQVGQETPQSQAEETDSVKGQRPYYFG